MEFYYTGFAGISRITQELDENILNFEKLRVLECKHLSQWILGWAVNIGINDNKSAFVLHPKGDNCHTIPLKGEIINAAVDREDLYFLLKDGSVVVVKDEAVMGTSEFSQLTYRVESTNGEIIKLVHLSAGELHVVGCRENGSVGILSHPRGHNLESKTEASNSVAYSDTIEDNLYFNIRGDNADSKLIADYSCSYSHPSIESDFHTGSDDFVSPTKRDNANLHQGGDNSVSQSHPGEDNSLVWKPLNVVHPVTQVSCGKEHVLMLTDTGQVFTYGLGSRGQLGHNSTENCDSPCLVQQLDGLKMVLVAAGGWHSVALSDIGDVYVWGWNESGQLGLPSKSVQEKRETCIRTLDDQSQKCAEEDCENVVTFATEPFLVDLADDVNVVDVGCGSRHSAIVTDTGVLLTTGWNDYGQLGQGDTISRDTFTAVSSLQERHQVVDSVICGYWSTLVQTSCKQDF